MKFYFHSNINTLVRFQGKFLPGAEKFKGKVAPKVALTSTQVEVRAVRTTHLSSVLEPF